MRFRFKYKRARSRKMRLDLARYAPLAAHIDRSAKCRRCRHQDGYDVMSAQKYAYWHAPPLPSGKTLVLEIMYIECFSRCDDVKLHPWERITRESGADIFYPQSIAVIFELDEIRYGFCYPDDVADVPGCAYTNAFMLVGSVFYRKCFGWGGCTDEPDWGCREYDGGDSNTERLVDTIDDWILTHLVRTTACGQHDTLPPYNWHGPNPELEAYKTAAGAVQWWLAGFSWGDHRDS